MMANRVALATLRALNNRHDHGASGRVFACAAQTPGGVAERVSGSSHFGRLNWRQASETQFRSELSAAALQVVSWSVVFVQPWKTVHNLRSTAGSTQRFY